MAGHEVAVAKATFAASLLRPDVTNVSRDEIPRIHTLIENVMHNGSTTTIQV
jgi:hypothetical protein